MKERNGVDEHAIYKAKNKVQEAQIRTITGGKHQDNLSSIVNHILFASFVFRIVSVVVERAKKTKLKNWLLAHLPLESSVFPY